MEILGKSDHLILIDTGIVDLKEEVFYKCNPQSAMAHNPYFLDSMPTEKEKEKVKEIIAKWK